MNVLSLFDGMSCGRQALERAGIKIDKYYASEIDKYAIKATMNNYPDTIQLGSVINVDGYSLPNIDILIGGSPCQSFSFAGKRKGMSTKDEQEILTLEHYIELKLEGFEFEGQSYLFWEYMRILKEIKPTFFLLENVMMGDKWELILSKAIGVKPIEINSSLVSAQNRRRLYWTNIGMKPSGLFGDLESVIPQPKNKKILLKDILQNDVDEKYFLSENMLNYLNKNSEQQKENGNGFSYKPTDGNEKGKAVTTKEDNRMENNFIIHSTYGRTSTNGNGGNGPLMRDDGKTYCLDTANSMAVEYKGLTQVRTEEAKKIRKETGTNPKRAKELVERTNDKIGALLTTHTPDNLIIKLKKPNSQIQKTIDKNTFEKGEIKALDFYNQYKHDLSPTLSNPSHGNLGLFESSRIRRLTPVECCRLQTVPDYYFKDENGNDVISETQQYKCLGNGWTIDVIAYIFSYISNTYKI